MDRVTLFNLYATALACEYRGVAASLPDTEAKSKCPAAHDSKRKI